MLDSLYPKYYLDIAGGDGYGGDGGGDSDSDSGEAPQDVTDFNSDAIGGVNIENPTVETITTVTFTDTGAPIYTTVPKYKSPVSGIHTITNIKGDFNPLYASAEIRRYTILGDVGSRFNLTVTSSDGHKICDTSAVITNSSGYVISITFPKVYEYATYIFLLRAGAQTFLGGGMPKIEYIKEIPQYIDPTITLSFATDDPYTTNCAYSGSDVTFTAKPLVEPKTYHTLNDKTYGKLTHTVAATITTGYLYMIKNPNISDYLLIDDRDGLSTADLDKTLELGTNETTTSGIITAVESASKKIITLTSVIQVNKVGKEDTIYELDIDSIITNIPQAYGQEVSTAKDTAVTINVFKGINISTYLTSTITSSPKHGVLSGGFVASPEAGVGVCVYTPPTLFQGVDEFTFEVADGTNTSENQYTVNINIGNVGCD